ncbi:uncharacterized protein LOC135344111 [Halichondria panicea]|uniref:uncharacterized protein LOC135344111 n=1 Tax=Halichondria panicea TaxID=6063 RepID=UPI00312B44F6
MDSIFSYDWDFVEPPSDEYICSACNSVLKKPILTGCCKKYFCIWCLNNPDDEDDMKLYCHNCSQICLSSVLDEQKWEYILNLNVKCPFSHRGCLWTGELHARASHLKPETGDCQYKVEEEVLSPVENLDVSQDLNITDTILLYDFDFVEPPPNEFICSACNSVLKKPILTGCCKMHFCTWCFNNPHDEDDKTRYCPECEKICSISIIDDSKWKRILELDVKCPFSHRGCLWTGEICARANHIQTETGDCQYINIECKYGCEEELEKYDYEEHLKYFCPRRPVTCEYCGMNGEQVVVSGEHKKDCPDIPTPCPNSCGIEPVKQKDLLQHLLECPEEIVECSFNYTGCNFEAKRKKLIEHIQENSLKHIQLQTQFFVKELDKKDDLIHKLETEKDQQLFELYNCHIKELIKLVEMCDIPYRELRIDSEKIVKDVQCNYKKLNEETASTAHLTWQISRDQLRYTTLLSPDKNEDTCEGTYKDAPVAIKMLPLGISSVDFLQEARTLMKLDHSNIIKLHGIVSNSEPICIILERMDHGTLEQYLRSTGRFLLHQQISMCKQVAQGLDYLHQNLCIHRNIRAETICIGQKCVCKISNFKKAKQLTYYKEEYIASKEEMIPARWSPPEVLLERKFILKSDVWSYGVLMYEIATRGRTPYPNQSNVEVIQRIISGHCMYQPSNCPPKLYSLMQDCWKSNPWRRPTFEAIIDLLEHVKDSHDYATVII